MYNKDLEKILSSYNKGVDFIYVDEINLHRKLVDIIRGYSIIFNTGERTTYCGNARRQAFKLLLALWGTEPVQDDLIYLAVNMMYDHTQVDVVKAITDIKITQNIALHIMNKRPGPFFAVKL